MEEPQALKRNSKGVILHPSVLVSSNASNLKKRSSTLHLVLKKFQPLFYGPNKIPLKLHADSEEDDLASEAAHVKVGNFELFFDLVFVAVAIQVSSCVYRFESNIYYSVFNE